MMRVAALALLLASAPAAAVDFAPGEDAIAQAADDGAAIAARKEGYPLPDYVLHEVRDARDLDPADGNVDAVVLATPLERVRHAAYREALSGHPRDVTKLVEESGLANGSIRVIIFAHGDDELDDAFPVKFTAIRLRAGTNALEPSSMSHTQPAETIYPLAKVDRERLVSAITLIFDLKAAGLRGSEEARLTFTDATGKPFDIAVPLAKFR